MRTPYAPKNVVQYSRHLDSALVTNMAEFYKSAPHQFFWEAGDWDASELISDHSGIVEGRPLFVQLEDTVLKRASVLFQGADKPLVKALEATTKSVQMQAEVIYGSLGIDQSCSPENLAAQLANHPDLVATWRGKLVVCKIHSEVAHAASSKPPEFTIPTLPGFVFRRNLIRIPVGASSHVIISYTWFLNVLDKIEAHFHATAYSLAVRNISPFAGTNFYELTKVLYHKLDQIYERLACQACSVYKMLEAICVGVILEEFGDECTDTEYLQRTLDGLQSSNMLVWVEASALADFLREYLRDQGERGVNSLMEQFGQEKMHWLPIGSEEAGMKKMLDYGTEIRSTEFSFCSEVKGVLFKRLLVSYYMREGSLIPILQDLFLDSRIASIYSTGVCPSLSELNKIPNSEWAKVVPKKVFEFNYLPDPLNLMDDKSCGVDRQQVAQYYSVAVQRELGLTAPGPKQERRFIQWILDQEVIDIEALFEACASAHGLAFAERIIAVLGKELENKYELRMYSVLHPHVRLRASTLERNISDSIYPYFNEQTTTSSGADLVKRIDRLTATMADPSKKVVAVHMDLKAWNHFHYESSTYQVQSLLNDLFGVKWWDQLMWPFQQSVFVSSESFNPPGIHGRENFWEGYNGGNQGICQKIWTLCTQMIIHHTMEGLTEKYELTGQGDNQVLLVDVTEEIDQVGLLRRLRANLAHNFSRFGLELKLEETWHSSALLAYQRKYYYKGVPLLGGLKQATKFAAGVKDGVYSLDSHCQTAMGSGMTLAAAVKHPFVGPFLAYLEMLSGILANPDWCKLLPTEVNKLVLLTWVGSELGYYSTLQLPSFMYSGNKDPLSDSLALLSLLYQKHPEFRQLIGRAVNIRFGDVNDERMLDFVLNPLSPNLQKSSTVEGRLQRLTEDDLMRDGRVRNRTIAALFKVSQRQDRITLAKQLCTIRPLNMSLVHALYESSHIGQAHSSLTKVSKVKSLIKMAERQDQTIADKGLAMATLDIDRRYAQEIRKRLESPVPLAMTFVDQLIRSIRNSYLQWATAVGWDPKCTFTARIFLIAHSWRLGDIVPRGPYIPSVIEQVRMMRSITPEQEKHSVIVTPAHSIPLVKDILDSSRGPFSLYVGSRTPDPSRTIKLVNLEGLDLAGLVRSLTAMFSWVTFKGSDVNIMKALCAEIDLRVPGLSDYLTNAGTFIVGGTMEHRFYTRGTDMGAWSLGKSLVSTWYRMSTDRASRFQDSDSNRLIFFQGILQHVVATLRVSPVQTSACYAVVEMEHCSYPVDEGDYSCLSAIKVPPLSVISVFRTSPRSLDSVKAELESKARVQELNLMTPDTDVEGLSAALAAQMARMIQKFQLGRFGGGVTDITQGPMRSPLNISLIRKVPLPTLLRSLFVALSFHRCLGPSSGFRSSLRRLQVLTSNNTGLQDVEAYRQVLDSLLTAGKMMELTQLVGHPPAWSVQQLSSKGVLFLLQGLQVAAEQASADGLEVSMVVELKHTNASVLGLHHFLRSWSAHYRQQPQLQDQVDPLAYLAARGGRASPLKIFVVSDIDVLIGQSRYLDPSGSLPVSVPNFVPLPDLANPRDANGPPMPVGYLGDQFPELPTPVEGVSHLSFQGTGIPHEEVTDLTQLVKWAAPASGARFKFAEVLSYLTQSISSFKLGVCLAEGGGSVCSLLLHLAPELRIVFNTLIISQTMSKSIGVGYYPPATLCPCLVCHRVVNVPYSSKFSGDLTLKGTWEEVEQCVRESGDSLDILTWDMEGCVENYQTAVTMLVEFLQSQIPRVCILKMFLHEGVELLAFVAEQLQRDGYLVQVIKPNTSNILNSEVFVLGERGLGTGITISYARINQWASALQLQCSSTGIRSWSRRVRQSASWVATLQPCAFSPPLLATARPLWRNHIHLSLTALGQAMVEWIGSYRDSGSQRERGFQHLLGSLSRGASIAVFDYYSTVAVIALVVQTSLQKQRKGPVKITGDIAWDWIGGMAPDLAAMATAAPDHYSRSLVLQKLGQVLSCWSEEQLLLCQVALGLVISLSEVSGLTHLQDAIKAAIEEPDQLLYLKMLADTCALPCEDYWSIGDWEEVCRTFIVFQRRLGYRHSQILSFDPWLKVHCDVFLGQCCTGVDETPSVTIMLERSFVRFLPEDAPNSDLFVLSLKKGWVIPKRSLPVGYKLMVHNGRYGTGALLTKN